jgi:asparagine synthase (glutamine-hydrolysing)
MGFAVPLASWFRGPLRQKLRDAVLGPVLAGSGLFDPVFLKHLVEQHQSGLRDYSAPLWSLLMFESFLRNVMGEEAPARARTVRTDKAQESEFGRMTGT